MPAGPENSDPNRRGAHRRLRPLSCEIEIGGKVHSGVIRDLSPQGLFVRTGFDCPDGGEVLVRVRRPGGEVWEIQARAARSSDGSTGMVSRRGLGLVIEEAPAGFHEFVADLVRKGGLPFALDSLEAFDARDFDEPDGA